MSKQSGLAVFRAVLALLALSSICTEIGALIERGTLVPANFFSYFMQTKRLAMLRGAATLYLAIVGIVFPLLLSNLNVEFTAISWNNIVLHYIMPIAAVVDWFADIPKSRISFRDASIWLVYPIVYVAYSLIRGQMVGWYPYPFLNPGVHGYGTVAMISATLLIAATGPVWILTRFTPRISDGPLARPAS